jgi:hypothetical protein
MTPDQQAWHFSANDVDQWVLTAPLWVMCWPSDVDLKIGLHSGKGIVISAILFILALIYWWFFDVGMTRL